MTKEIRSPNVEKLSVVRSPVSSFGFRHSVGFRQSSFGFENCSLFNQKAGQRTGESGRESVGSWRAAIRFYACIGTMKRSGGTQLVWSPAFRRSGPAKAGTPNGRFMERGGAASPRAVLELHRDKPSPPRGAVAPVHPAVV